MRHVFRALVTEGARSIWVIYAREGQLVGTDAFFDLVSFPVASSVAMPSFRCSRDGMRFQSITINGTLKFPKSVTHSD